MLDLGHQVRMCITQLACMSLSLVQVSRPGMEISIHSHNPPYIHEGVSPGCLPSMTHSDFYNYPSFIILLIS